MSDLTAAQSDQITADTTMGNHFSGGSAANTAAALRMLGGRTHLVAKVGPDAVGQIFCQELSACGIGFDPESIFATHGATGRVFVLVTPDGERTQGVVAGVSSELSAQDVAGSPWRRSKFTLVEGYLVGRPSAQAAVDALVFDNDPRLCKLALTLADAQWLAAHKEHFRAFLPAFDIVLGNAAEALEISNSPTVEEAVEWLAARVETVAITLGVDGALVAQSGQLRRVPGVPVEELVNTVGAGDAFAGGFIYASAQGAPTTLAAAHGCHTAALVVQQAGARLRSVPGTSGPLDLARSTHLFCAPA